MSQRTYLRLIFAKKAFAPVGLLEDESEIRSLTHLPPLNENT